MSRFLISPGVITREVDNSQYTATGAGLGNIAAIVGYAEKGPFEPTLVSGTQNFVEKFGKTLVDAPYLAQAAYKYFEENDNLLVVRAGNNQDPEAYPKAAQYSSIKVRLNPLAKTATAGSQSFVLSENVKQGSFNTGVNYGFKVLSDFRAFKTPKYLETWVGKAVETSSSIGPSPITAIYNTVFKAAFATSGSGTFEANYKREHSAGSTAEYSGTGTKTGSSFGDTIKATLFKYKDGGAFAPSTTDFITLNASHAANTIGSVNVASGFLFDATPASFKVTLGPNQYTVILNEDVVNATALVAKINSQFRVVTDSNGIISNISTMLEAVLLQQTASTFYVMIKKINSTVTSFTLVNGVGNALDVLGIQAGQYKDEDGIVGTWGAEAPVSEVIQTFNGVFGYTLVKKETAALSFEEYINISIQAPNSGVWNLNDIATKINTQLTLAYDGNHTDDSYYYDITHPYSDKAARAICSINPSTKKVEITSSGVASNLKSLVRIASPSVGNSLIPLLTGVNQYVDGISPTTDTQAIYTIKAKEKGSYGQTLTLRTETKRVSLGSQQVTYNNVYVLLNGYETSTYQKINWADPADANFFITRMANDEYISIEADDEDEDGVFAQIPDGDWKLGQGSVPEGVNVSNAVILGHTVGTNGWVDDPTTTGLIDSMSADFVNALKKIYNPEVYEFNLVAAPGTADPIVQNAIQALCESRRDCFGIIDAAPFGLGFGIKDGLSDITEVTTSCSTINSSYVGAFWPWLQDYDADNQQYVWLPPSIYALKSMVYTDNISDPWFAPAGTTRGKVSALDVEYSPSRTDRDLLYGDSNIVNPIVFFVNEGITIWGQKTGQRTKSSTDRINVRRLLIYAEKLIAKMARGFLFEPNDSANWSAFTRQANAILEPIRQRRGFYTYSVVCDATTNTSDLINQNIMAGKIFVTPTKTTEFIEVEFTINASGDVTVSE